MTKPIIEPFLNNNSPLPRENRQGAVFIASIICKMFACGKKIGVVQRVDEIFFKLLFTDEAEMGVSDVLDFDIMKQGG